MDTRGLSDGAAIYNLDPVPTQRLGEGGIDVLDGNTALGLADFA